MRAITRNSESYVDATKLQLAATSLKDSLVAGLRPSSAGAAGGIGFVLADRMRERGQSADGAATAREKEIAIRKAMGASKRGGW